LRGFDERLGQKVFIGRQIQNGGPLLRLVLAT
jgi:hypothetical protein